MCETDPSERSLPLRLHRCDVAEVLHCVHHLESFFQLIIDHDPKTVVEIFEKIDYVDLKEASDLFVGMTVNFSLPDDEHRYVWDSPLAAQVGNYLEEKYTDRTPNTNVMVAMYAWLSFNLDRISSRLKQKMGGPRGAEAVKELVMRRARNNGCAPQFPKPVDPEFDKKVREAVDKIVDMWRERFAELAQRTDGLLNSMCKVEDEKDALKKKNALLEQRVAILERENRATAETKRKFAEKIKNLKKSEKEMKEKVEVLEKKCAVLEEVNKTMGRLVHRRTGWECDEDFEEQISWKEDKARLETKTLALETEIVGKDKAMEEKIKASEDEKDAMKKKMAYVSKRLQENVEATKQHTEWCSTVKTRIEGLERELTMLKGMRKISKKSNAAQPKEYGAGLYEFLVKKHPGIKEVGTPEWRMFEAQLLLPLLIDKELAQKLKTENASVFETVVDLFTGLGIRPDSEEDVYEPPEEDDCW